MKSIGKSTSIELCPYCKTAVNMRITIMTRTVAAEDGKRKVIVVKTYHCESCRSLVKSTEEVPAKNI